MEEANKKKSMRDKYKFMSNVECRLQFCSSSTTCFVSNRQLNWFTEKYKPRFVVRNNPFTSLGILHFQMNPAFTAFWCLAANLGQLTGGIVQNFVLDPSYRFAPLVVIQSSYQCHYWGEILQTFTAIDLTRTGTCVDSTDSYDEARYDDYVQVTLYLGTLQSVCLDND